MTKKQDMFIYDLDYDFMNIDSVCPLSLKFYIICKMLEINAAC